MGASFPGTGLVELGRGRDYAWSATSSGTDLIDQRVEQICDPAGGRPAAQGTSYLFHGRCLPMSEHTFSETAFPKPGGVGAPTVLRHRIYRTRHGVVQGWTTVHGRPVAIVNQRSTYATTSTRSSGSSSSAHPARCTTCTRGCGPPPTSTTP